MHSVTYDASGSGAISLLALPQLFLKIIVQYKYLNYSHFVDLKKTEFLSILLGIEMTVNRLFSLSY